MNKMLLAIFIFFALTELSAQSHKNEIKQWRQELNEEFLDPEESPLDAEDLKHFKKLKFYPADEKYSIEANFERTPHEEPFKMPTSTERLPVYVKYGVASFQLDGKNLKLSVFQNQAVSETDEYSDYLFLPFTDPTNGNGSYVGGRYIDVRIPEGEILHIDFNKAYNPYCAYSDRYSCPIPPRENRMPIEIKAGVKAWKHH